MCDEIVTREQLKFEQAYKSDLQSHLLSDKLKNNKYQISFFSNQKY